MTSSDITSESAANTVSGRITAGPNPLPAETDRSTTLAWETNAKAAELCVSEDNMAEKLVASGSQGSLDIEWIRAGKEYVFRLYTSEPRQLLDELTVFRKIVGRIAADPNPLPIEADSKTMLHWEITPPVIGEIRISEDGAEEKVVCRGQSGSFEVAGLRAARKYLFRLYAATEPPQLLDAIEVRLKDIPWAQLRKLFAEAIDGGKSSAQLGEFLAGVLPECVHAKDYPEWFQLWESRGFHVTPVHFYEPIPDSQDLPEKLWASPRELVGVDMRESQQLELLSNVFPTFREEYEAIPTEASGDDRFYLNNGRFEGLDAIIAYCMVRHYRPRHIIEVGGGYSTLLLAQAARRNGDTTLLSIEPYPEGFLRGGPPGLDSLRMQKVEDVDLSCFQQLEAGDLLFIDTSHVVRIGGDVNFLYLEVLPRLKPGTLVHVHDIFLPFEYPRDWVLEQRRFWTEQYLLQAFLAFNSEFEVLVSSAYLKACHAEKLEAVFPSHPPWQGGSFWMRRKPA